MIQAHHIKQATERTQQALIVAEHKPSPKGQGGGSSNVEPPMPLPAGVISAKRELRDMLLDWVGLVSEGLAVVAHCDPTEASMLTWLGSGERADYLAAHEAAQDFLEEITEVTKQLESPYLPRAGKKYWVNHEGQAIYIRDGQRDVKLDDGTTVPVMTLKDAAADKLLDYEGTAEQVALIINKYFGHEELTARKISDARNDDARPGKGRKNGKLESIRKENSKHIYKVYDVLIRFYQKEFSSTT